jgi:DNA-binding FadR family transcriptional regulator
VSRTALPERSQTIDAGAGIRPIAGVSMAAEVHARIRGYIVENRLQPGDRLPGEETLAAQMGVGRPLVREALRGLEAIGLIETRKGVGRFVRALEAESYLSQFPADIFVQSFSENDLEETRCLLEIAAVSNAVQQLTDDDCAQILRYIEALRLAAAQGRDDSESDLGMHRVIMSRARNRIIAALLDAVYALSTMRGANGDRTQAMREHDLAEHEAIVAAAIRRDGPAARAALIAHFETTASRLGFRPLWRNLYGERHD